MPSDELEKALAEYFSLILANRELLNSMLIKSFMAEHVCDENANRTSMKGSFRDGSFIENNSLGDKLNILSLKRKRKNRGTGNRSEEEEDEEEEDEY